MTDTNDLSPLERFRPGAPVDPGQRARAAITTDDEAVMVSGAHIPGELAALAERLVTLHNEVESLAERLALVVKPGRPEPVASKGVDAQPERRWASGLADQIDLIAGAVHAEIARLRDLRNRLDLPDPDTF